jgi:hypothetical protein
MRNKVLDWEWSGSGDRRIREKLLGAHRGILRRLPVETIDKPAEGQQDCVRLFAAFRKASSSLWRFNGIVESSPAVANGVVYVGTDGHRTNPNLFALNAKTGLLLWSATHTPKGGQGGCRLARRGECGGLSQLGGR